MDEDLKEEFIMDMEDLLVKMEKGIIGIEKDEKNPESLNELFRVMHSVKGVSAMMELNSIEKLSHGMENLLFEVRDGKMEINIDIINLLFLCKDYFSNFLINIKTNNIHSGNDEAFIEEIIKKISGVRKKTGRKKKVDISEVEKVALLSKELLENIKIQNEKIYKVKIFIAKDCQMKKMRAYMILKECIEKYFSFGEIPLLKDLENEENIFNGTEIYISLITAEEIKEITEFFSEIPEVKEIIVEEVKKLEEKILYEFEAEKNRAVLKKFVPEEFKKEFYDEIKKQISDIEKSIMGITYDIEKMNIIIKNFNTVSGLGKLLRQVELSSVAEETINYIEKIKNSIDKYEQNDIKGLLLNSIQLMSILTDIENEKIDDTLVFKIEYHQNMLEMAAKKTELLNSSEFKGFIKDIKEISVEEAENLNKLKKIHTFEKSEVKKENESVAKIEIKEEEIKSGEIRVATHKIEKLNELISELQMVHSIIEDKSEKKDMEITNEVTKMNSLTKEIRNIVAAMNNLPLNILYQKMNRVFRDALKKTDKKAELITTGESTEIERAVMEKITEPMVHIIKNTLAHGIEEENERKNIGKSETGVVKIEGYLNRNSVYIEISDDGRGIDVETIYKKAYEKNIAVKEFSEYSEKEIMEFIFAPGFSTAEKIDEMAGRGVGMDVVKSEIGKLGGAVYIESKKNKGTKITLKIPVNSMIVNGMTVEIDSKKYIIPTVYVNEIVDNINLEITEGLKNKRYVKIRESVLEIEDISHLINSEYKKRRVLLVIENKEKKRVIPIDRIIDRRDVTLTKLEIDLNGKLPFSGGTILGDGSVCLIIDMETVMEQ